MKRQSTSIGRSSVTLTTHRDVSQAQGHTGSQKNSRSAMAPVYPADASGPPAANARAANRSPIRT